MMRKIIPLIAMSVFLCGCPKPTQYVRPALPVPSTWPESSVAGAEVPGAPVAADLKWREFFTDQRLQSVIELALANNRDLRVAALNIEKAQAFYRIQRAQQYPTITASAGGEAYRLPKNLSGSDGAETIATYTVGLGIASWELDLFGRIRSLKSSALEQYLATEQARSAAQISLVASVAQIYLALVADREDLKLAQETLDAQQASYDLILKTREAGIASDLEVRQAQSQVEAARVDIARYTGQLALDESALNLLVGAPVSAGLLADDLGKVDSMKDVAAGLPSDVLLRRPDILAAEHQLKSASANINAARAAYFPRISLTAAAGIISSDLTNLFKPAAGTWTFAPQATLPIFDAGARQANYRLSEVERDIAIAAYEKAIQAAFREVSDALSLKTNLVAQQSAMQSLVNALDESYRLSEARYQGGIDSYLGVLVNQRALYSAQQRLVSVRFARLSNLVTLYKVLGGGA
jgi:outer membrane protein, multidrug efflux system